MGRKYDEFIIAPVASALHHCTTMIAPLLNYLCIIAQLLLHHCITIIAPLHQYYCSIAPILLHHCTNIIAPSHQYHCTIAPISLHHRTNIIAPLYHYYYCSSRPPNLATGPKHRRVECAGVMGRTTRLPWLLSTQYALLAQQGAGLFLHPPPASFSCSQISNYI